MTAPDISPQQSMELVQAAAAGRLVDLRADDAELDDPARGANWDAERTVRAGLLAELLTGVRVPDGGRLRAVKLRGARITGRLDLEAAELVCPVLLVDCHFDEPVNLSEATAAAIRLPGCHLPGLAADQLRTTGNLELNRGFTVGGKIRLVGANVGGTLDLSGATVVNPGGHALVADGLTAAQDVICQNLTAEGEVALTGAHIGGQLNLDGARLTNPSGYALSASSLTVSRGMWCRDGFTAEGEVFLPGSRIQYFDLSGGSFTNSGGVALFADALAVERGLFFRGGFTAEGEVRLPRAHIGDRLSFAGAFLSNPDGSALNLEAAEVATLIFRPGQRPDGEVNLANARVGVLDDDYTAWPATLRLRGLTYDVLANDQVSVRARLRWLSRDPGGYIPQLYDQLAAAYRAAGHEEAARQAAVAKQWHRRKVLNPIGKLTNWLLYLTVGYGYRTWLAAAWLAGMLALGTLVFESAYPDQITAAEPNPPRFHALAYAMDVLLPIGDIGQQKAWQPEGAAMYWSWAFMVAGWVLVTAVVAGLTGILRRN